MEESYNSKFANLLSRLSDAMMRSGEPMKARAYKKGEETILGFTTDIRSIDDIKGKSGIGTAIVNKLQEYIDTGKIRVLDEEENKPERVFTDIYGIGPKKAKELVQQGITSIDELRKQQDKVLNEVQRKGLLYYEDILKRIPREEIDEYGKIFDTAFPREQETHYEIVGSYRRGLETSGDIDVIVGSPNSSVFDRFLDQLIQENIITAVLSRGKNKCLVVAKIPTSDTYRRVDFLYTIPEEYPFSVLYFTGSKGFNAVMRGHALTRGFSLNEHGFTVMDGKTKSERLSRTFLNEKDIFDFLELEYKEPSERVDGRAVVPIVGKIPDLLVEPVNKEKKRTYKKREPKSKTLKISPIKETLEEPIKEPIDEPIEKPVEKPKEEIQEKPKKKRTYKKREPKSKTLKMSPIKEPLEEPIEEPLEEPMEKPIEEPIEQPIKEPIEQPKEEIQEKPKEEIQEKPKKKRTYKKREPKLIKLKPNVLEEDAEPKIEIMPSRKKTIKKREPKVDKKSSTSNITNFEEMVSIEKTIVEFKEKGIPVLEALNEQTLNQIITYANDAYYNETPVLNDNEYDIVREYLAKKAPTSEALQEIGAPIQGKNKVNLPFEMASMDKIKPDTGALKSWTAKYTGPYVLSCKLDGVSGLYVCDQEGKYKLYTRGNGLVGQDVSHLIKVLKLPSIQKGMAVRGEFILSKNTFSSKYKSEFANARNLVSGIINRKSADEKARDLDFVSYEVVMPPMKPSDQMRTLQESGFKTVLNKTVSELTNEFLSDLLLQWRKEYDYEIDGVIVTNDAIYERQHGNPEHAFAFKMVISDQVAEAKVVDVVWEASKDGYLKPRVRIEPIHLGGVNIEYATGFNGKFIEENKIGIGAVIMMVRSGDVIPYIQSVSVPAEKPKMPSVPYIWNKTHVDVLLENPEDDETVQEKNVTAFFVSLGVDGLAKGNIKKLFKMGKNTVAKIIEMSVHDFEQVEGFKTKTAEKLFNGIKDKIAQATLLDIMVASGKLGRGLGERKLKPILDKYPDILISPHSADQKESMLQEVQGIGKENAREFVKNIPTFLEFVEECHLENKIREPTPEVRPAVQPPAIAGHALCGKKIVMTKIRDKDIIDFLAKAGATLEDNMKKDTMVLIVKSKEDVSNKTEYATKNGIPMMTPDEFKQTYMS